MVRELFRAVTSNFLHENIGNLDESNNLPELFSKLTEALGGQVRTIVDPETEKLMFSGPTIIVANHASFPPVIFNFLKKTTQRVGLFINESFKTILNLKSETLRKNLLSISLKNHNYISPGGIAEIVFPSNIKDSNRELENGKSAVEGVKILEEGGIVVIFPTGGIGKDWFSGVGTLIKSVNRKGKNVNIIFAHIDGTSTFDTLRIGIPSRLRRRLPSFKATVYYKYFSNGNNYRYESKEEITAVLHKEYDEWAKNIKYEKV